MMKRIAITSQSGGTGSCVLWREDISALLILFETLAGQKPTIKSGTYEYDSAEELFEHNGPSISDLDLSNNFRLIEVKLSRAGSRVSVVDRDVAEK